MSKKNVITVVPNIRCKDNKDYYFRFNYVDNTGKKKCLERGPFTSQNEAQNARSEFSKEFDLQRDKEKKKEYTFDEVYMIFMEKNINKYDPRTIGSYDSVYNKHLKALLGNQLINRIDMNYLTDHFAKMYKNYSYNYVQGIYKKLKVIFKFANDRELLEINNIHRVKLPTNKDIKKDNIFTEEELIKMDERFKKTKSMYVSYLLLKYLGLRNGECFGLLWEDVDFDKKTIKIERQMSYQKTSNPKSKTKNEWVLKSTKNISSIREIDLPPTLYDYLVELKEVHDKDREVLGKDYIKTKIDLYNAKGVKIQTIKNPDFINKKTNTKGIYDGEWYIEDSIAILARIAKNELGIDFKSHNFRRTHASLLNEKGVPSVAIQNRLGHSSYLTTAKYYIKETKGARDILLNELSQM